MQEVVTRCTQFQGIFIFSPQDAKEPLNQTIRRARPRVVRFKGVGRTELEDAMLHQACAVRDLDLNAI